MQRGRQYVGGGVLKRKKDSRQAEIPSSNCVHINVALQKAKRQYPRSPEITRSITNRLSRGCYWGRPLSISLFIHAMSPSPVPPLLAYVRPNADSVRWLIANITNKLPLSQWSAKVGGGMNTWILIAHNTRGCDDVTTQNFLLLLQSPKPSPSFPSLPPSSIPLPSSVGGDDRKEGGTNMVVETDTAFDWLLQPPIPL